MKPIYLNLWNLCFLLLLPFTLTAQDWVKQNPSGGIDQLYDIYMDSTGFGWTGGNGGSLYYTQDFGQTWAPRFVDVTSSPIFYLDYLPGSNGRHIVAVGTQVLASQDGGLSWNVWIPDSSLGGYNGVEAISDTEAFAISNRGYLLKTSDAGQTWVNMPVPSSRQWSSICFLNDTLGWMGDVDGKIVHTTDGGQSWTVLDSSSMATTAKVAFLNAQIGYASSYRDFYRTTDGGQTWTEMATNIFATHLRQIHIVNDSTILGCVNGRFYKSTDYGANWTFQQPHPYRSTTNGFTVFPDGRIWLSGGTTTVMYSDDDGQTWEDQFPGVKGNLFFVDFLDGERGIVGGAYETMMKTQDGGRTWEDISLNDSDESLQAGFMLDSTEFWIMTKEKIQQTLDGGQTWSTKFEPATDLLKSLIQAPNGDFWATHQDDGLYRSADAGMTWESVFDPPTGRIFYADFMTDSLGFVLGEQGALYRTVDGGSTWDSIATGSNKIFLKIEFGPANQMWLFESGLQDSLIYSADKGLTWSKQEAPRRALQKDIQFINDSTGWLACFLGSTGYLYRTDDGGLTWNPTHTTPVPLSDIAAPLTDSVRVWIIGRGGWIEFKGDTSQVMTNIDMEQTNNFKLYPNPANQHLYLQMDADGALGPYTVELISMQGVVLWRKEVTQTWAPVEINIQNLSLPYGAVRVMREGKPVFIQKILIRH
ncbi:MAG: YCF48-related protein [Bacteroidota bacterium]